MPYASSRRRIGYVCAGVATVLFLLSGIVGPARADWAALGPNGRTILSVAIDPVSPATIYAGTNGSGVFKTTTGGSAWSQEGLANRIVHALAMTSGSTTTLYAGTYGGVYKTTDGGTSWKPLGLQSHAVFTLVVDPEGSTTLYAGTETGVFKSTDGGVTWNTPGLSSRMVLALALNPNAPTTLYAGTYGGVYKTTDGGTTWKSIGLSNQMVLSLALDPETFTILHAGTEGGVFRSINDGVSWTAMWTTPFDIRALRFDPDSVTTLYAGTDDGVFRWTAPLVTLTVVKEGPGRGTVTSQPAGIVCGTDCAQAYISGTHVALKATPAAGSTFVGWGGACLGTGSCVVTMDAARRVTATFVMPTVTVRATDATATETGLTRGAFTFTRTGSTAAALTVSFRVTGTATAGMDYVSLGSSVVIPAGATSVTKPVTPLQDTLQEVNESIILTLLPGTVYAVGTPGAATVVLGSDESITRTVTVRATDATATETGLTRGAFTFTRTGSTAAALTVSYRVTGTATPGRDYVSLGASVTFPPNIAVVVKPVTPIQDSLQELKETVIVTLTESAAYAVGSPGSAVVVLDSDEPVTQTVTVRATDPVATEAGLTDGVFTFVRSGSLAKPLTVFFSVDGTATPGTDYVGLGSSVLIPAGAASAVKRVVPRQDTLAEPNETVVVTLSQASTYAVGTPAAASITLISDDK